MDQFMSLLQEMSHTYGRIHEMVDEMQRKLKLAGHVVDTSVVLLNVDEEEKENALIIIARSWLWHLV